MVRALTVRGQKFDRLKKFLGQNIVLIISVLSDCLINAHSPVFYGITDACTQHIPIIFAI